MTRTATRVLAPRADLYVYGLMSSLGSLPDELLGVTRRTVETIDLDGVIALVSRDVDPDELGLAEDLLAHTRVLDAVAASTDVVPLAFGTLLPPVRDAGGAWSTLRAAFDAASGSVAGAVQYTLTVRYAQQVALAELVAEDRRIARLRDATAGTAEHEARAEKLLLGRLVVEGLERKAASEAAHVLAAIGPTTRALSRRERREADEIVEVAVLVERDRADRFTETCEVLAESFETRASVRLLGPQAPYDFVGGADRWDS